MCQKIPYETKAAALEHIAYVRGGNDCRRGVGPFEPKNPEYVRGYEAEIARMKRLIDKGITRVNRSA